MAKLTAKQQMFVKEYLVDLNATQAAKRAGYSAKRADAIGYELLRKPEIAAAVQEAMNERAKRVEITGDRVLQEIGKLAFANIQDFYDENGSLKNITDLPRELAVALHSTKINLTEACAVQEVKLHDKIKSLELLGRHLKLWKDVGSEENPARVIHKIERIVVKPK